MSRYKVVERVVEQREQEGEQEYFCKWEGLPYSECTWEPGRNIAVLYVATRQSATFLHTAEGEKRGQVWLWRARLRRGQLAALPLCPLRYDPPPRLAVLLWLFCFRFVATSKRWTSFWRVRARPRCLDRATGPSCLFVPSQSNRLG